MNELWENEEVLKMMREFIEKASKREAVCECNFDMASEEWFNYIEKEHRVSLNDYELEMLNEKYGEERNKYPQRLRR